MDIIQEEIEKTGILNIEKCPKCNSYNTGSVIKQMRSSDEAGSTIIECYNCGEKTRKD